MIPKRCNVLHFMAIVLHLSRFIAMQNNGTGTNNTEHPPGSTVTSTTLTPTVATLKVTELGVDPSQITLDNISATFTLEIYCRVNALQVDSSHLMTLALEKEVDDDEYELLAEVTRSSKTDPMGEVKKGENVHETATFTFKDLKLTYRDDKATCSSAGYHRCRLDALNSLGGDSGESQITETCRVTVEPKKITLKGETGGPAGQPTMTLTCTCFYLDHGEVHPVDFTWTRWDKKDKVWVNVTEGVVVESPPSAHQACTDPQTSTLTKTLVPGDKNALYQCYVLNHPGDGDSEVARNYSARFNVGDIDFEEESDPLILALQVVFGFFSFFLLAAFVEFVILKPHRHKGSAMARRARSQAALPDGYIPGVDTAVTPPPQAPPATSGATTAPPATSGATTATLATSGATTATLATSGATTATLATSGSTTATTPSESVPLKTTVSDSADPFGPAAAIAPTDVAIATPAPTEALPPVTENPPPSPPPPSAPL